MNMRNIVIFLVFLIILVTTLNFSKVSAQDVIEIKQSFKASCLCGNIQTKNGDALGGVSVEILGKNWKKSLQSTMTNSEGFFTFSESKERVYYLRIKKEGFDTLLVRIVINRDEKNDLVINLPVSN